MPDNMALLYPMHKLGRRGPVDAEASMLPRGRMREQMKHALATADYADKARG